MATGDNCNNMTDPIEFYVDLTHAVEASEAAVAAGTATDSNVTRIEVLKTGKWNTAKGKFEITGSDLSQMAENFQADVRPHSSTHGLPIDDEHKKKAAFGWLHNPQVEANDKGGQTLFMDAKWTPKGKEMVTDGTFKFFSPEIHFKHEDSEGTLPPLRNVLMGGGLTNRPLFKGLAGIPALQANDGTSDESNKIYVNEKESIVDLSTIRGKKNAEVTADERKLLDAAKDQLNETEKAEFYPDEAAAAAQKAADDKAAADKAAADKATADKVAASEGATVTLDASEVATLQANAAAGLEASEKLKHNEAEAEVTEMCFSEADGIKLPTDMKPQVTALWLNASETEKATLKTIFEKSKPLLDANDRREMGTNQGEGQGDAASLLEDKVVELTASEAYKGKSYSEVLKAARAQFPDLAKEADLEDERSMAAVGSR